ncbi:transcription factor bHLH85-like, partial [Vigna radiata var. radiata]|uniref:Transcription factor bHLH85-like n=1 Tax=Vigna radiata var. radiata TaxID=3916 RepID=A0A3Q0FH16_VIGRR
MDESWEKWFSDLEMDDDKLHLFNEHDVNSLEEELMKGESSVPYDSDFSIKNNNNMENISCLETNTNSSSEKNQELSSSFEDSTVVSNDVDEAFHAEQKKRSTLQTEQHKMSETRDKIRTMMEMGDDEFHLFTNSLEEELMKVESTSGFDINNKKKNNIDGGSCLKTNTQHANSGLEKHICSCTLAFEDSTVVSNVSDEALHAKPEKKRSTFHQTNQHIMAERKRREKISTMMVELSAMLPGLKKLDKISILGKTIDYVKHLQNRVKDLQEQKRKDVRIRVICDRRQHIVAKLFSKLESHHLSIVGSSVLPLGSSALNICIICQVEHFSMAIDDLVNILNED